MTNSHHEPHSRDQSIAQVELREGIMAWRGRWRRARLADFIQTVLPPVLLGGMTALALLDMILALPPVSRAILLGLTITGILLLIIRNSLQVMSFSLKDTAAWIDSAAGEKRHPLLTAFELLRKGNQAPEAGLSAFHLARLTSQANDVLARIPRKAVRGTTRKKGNQIHVVISGAVFLGLALLPGGRVSIARAVAPWLDIPPWSNLQFDITPSPVRVVYGDGVEIQARITGETLKRDVLLRTRDANGKRETICFEEGDSTFSQRLEHVTAPLTFCFSSGRARSQWRAVELLLRPRVLSATMDIVPPEYSRRPPRSFAVGEKPVRALSGAEITLTLTTNRPLRHGAVSFTDPRDGQRSTREAKIEGTQAMFTWMLIKDADLDVVVTGIDGLAGADPIKLRQTIIPDNPPVTEITEIPGFALATPESIVDIGVRAEDDLGISRVDLVRAVAGYRDRALLMGPEKITVDYESKIALNLAEVGIVPGEVIEFFAEGRDTNPTLGGISTSAPARLQVISQDEYAAILRKRTTMDEFATRFQVARATVQELQKILRELREAHRQGTWDGARLNEARIAAAEQAEMAAELFEKLGGDFPIYDLEKRFGADLLSYAGDLKVAAHFLRRFEAENEAFSSTLDFVIDEKVGPGGEALAATVERSNLATLVGRAMRKAALFNGVVKEQVWLTRVILRAAGGRVPDLPLLKNQAAPQRELAQSLANWLNSLKALAADMPAELAELKEDIETFVSELERLRIVSLMDECADAAEAGRSAEARQKAEEIINRLMRMRGECAANGNCVAQMMGGQLGFSPPEDLQQTLQEMLDCLKNGSGTASGQGGGGGPGDPNDGYSVADEGVRNVPMYGPERTRFRAADTDTPGQRANRGEGGQSGTGVGQAVAAPSRETRGDGTTTTGEGADLAPFRRVHPRYRGVIRRYNEY
ncbi:MAG: hypothetical protein RRC34_13110 [Lentisphaeria bacterium]|nr:hypothetical protein [Lentisphaeria bacterium]